MLFKNPIERALIDKIWGKGEKKNAYWLCGKKVPKDPKTFTTIVNNHNIFVLNARFLIEHALKMKTRSLQVYNILLNCLYPVLDLLEDGDEMDVYKTFFRDQG
jgi:hypothetical protein